MRSETDNGGQDAVRAALHEVAGDIVVGAFPGDRVLSDGARIRSRRRTVTAAAAALAVAAVLALLDVGANRQSDDGRLASVSPSAFDVRVVEPGQQIPIRVGSIAVSLQADPAAMCVEYSSGAEPDCLQVPAGAEGFGGVAVATYSPETDEFAGTFAGDAAAVTLTAPDGDTVDGEILTLGSDAGWGAWHVTAPGRSFPDATPYTVRIYNEDGQVIFTNVWRTRSAAPGSGAPYTLLR